MQSVYFEGAQEIGKPPGTTNEQVMSAYAMPFVAHLGPGPDGEPMAAHAFLLHYMPSKEDIEAIAAGRGIWMQILCQQLVPHSIFTLDQAGESNDAG